MISVVIPTYNGKEHLKTCFESLKNQIYKGFRIILVDNASNDGTVEYVEKEFPEVHIIKMDHNPGFAFAVNVGIKDSLNDDNLTHILLLNNDIECDNRFLLEMLNGLVTNDTGFVASKMLNYYNRSIIDDAGDGIKMIGSPFARGHGEEDKGQYDTPGFILGACAGAALYKREVFEAAGFFDEDFFAYYEDIDFSLRLQIAGYKCYYNPKAICYHKRGATTNNIPGFQVKLCERNLILLRIKNYPLGLYIRLYPLFFIGRLKRYFDYLKNNGAVILFTAVQGYSKGLIGI